MKLFTAAGQQGVAHVVSKRSIEVRHIGGFQELLHSTVLTSPESRAVAPDPDTMAKIKATAVEFVVSAELLLDDSSVVPFVAIKWPDDGPAVRGLLVALNPRHHADTSNGEDHFLRVFTETEEASEGVAKWSDVDEELARYSVAHFGKPTAVQ